MIFRDGFPEDVFFREQTNGYSFTRLIALGWNSSEKRAKFTKVLDIDINKDWILMLYW